MTDIIIRHYYQSLNLGAVFPTPSGTREAMLSTPRRCSGLTYQKEFNTSHRKKNIIC